MDNGDTDVMSDVRDVMAAELSEPVSEPSVSEQPVSEPSVSEQPVSEQPVSEPSVSEPSVSEQPVAYEGADGEGTWKDDRAPSSWTPKIRERWNEIDPDIRKEIIRREEASVRGVRQMQERFQPVEQFIKSLPPGVVEGARARGVSVEDYIAQTLQINQMVENAPTPEKFQMLLRIADHYKIPVREVINESVGFDAVPQRAAAAIPEEFQREIALMRHYRESMERDSVLSELDNFSRRNEFFEDVRYEMGQLIESGVCSTLDEAYERAIWADPEVRQVLLARAAQSQSAGAVAQRQAAAAKVAVKSGGSAPYVAPDDGSDDSIEAMVRSAYARSQGGRL